MTSRNFATDHFLPAEPVGEELTSLHLHLCQIDHNRQQRRHDREKTRAMWQLLFQAVCGLAWAVSIMAIGYQLGRTAFRIFWPTL